MEFDGLVEAGSFANVTKIALGCNIVDVKWLCNWEGDSHCMHGRQGESPYGGYGL